MTTPSSHPPTLPGYLCHSLRQVATSKNRGRDFAVEAGYSSYSKVIEAMNQLIQELPANIRLKRLKGECVRPYLSRVALAAGIVKQEEISNVAQQAYYYEKLGDDKSFVILLAKSPLTIAQLAKKKKVWVNTIFRRIKKICERLEIKPGPDEGYRQCLSRHAVRQGWVKNEELSETAKRSHVRQAKASRLYLSRRPTNASFYRPDVIDLKICQQLQSNQYFAKIAKTLDIPYKAVLVRVHKLVAMPKVTGWLQRFRTRSSGKANSRSRLLYVIESQPEFLVGIEQSAYTPDDKELNPFALKR